MAVVPESTRSGRSPLAEDLASRASLFCVIRLSMPLVHCSGSQTPFRGLPACSLPLRLRSSSGPNSAVTLALYKGSASFSLRFLTTTLTITAAICDHAAMPGIISSSDASRKTAFSAYTSSELLARTRMFVRFDALGDTFQARL